MITERTSSAITERLEAPAQARRTLASMLAAWQARDTIPAWQMALLLWATFLLIGYAVRLVVRADSQALAVLAAFAVAGVIWFAFGKRG